MTGAEWLACQDSSAMLGHVRDRASGRKLRLFAAACCRRVAHMLLPEAQRGIDLVERVADGDASEAERRAGRDAAMKVGWLMDDGYQHRRGPAKAAVAWALARRPLEAAAYLTQLGTVRIEDRPGLLREIFTPPGDRPVSGDSRTPLVLSLAKAAYTERELPSGALDHARLAVLSDALEEAGCTDAPLLTHLRSPGPHVRGCWALDLILGKV